MQLGHHDLRGGNFLAIEIHHLHRNAAAVVDHSNRVVDMDADFDLVSVSGKSFVNRVVDDLIYEMVQAQLAGRADVHSGALSDGFHPAENFDGIGGVIAVAVGASFAVLCRIF